MDLAKLFASLDPNQVALGGVVTFMVISLIRGWVVPRSVLVDRIADKDQHILTLVKERDDWHEAHNVSEVGRSELKDQNSALIEGAKVSSRLLETLRLKVTTGPVDTQVGSGS